MNDDSELLRRFAETRDEACFAQVVQRHIGFVHAVTLRRLRDPHAAQDATQAVFVALARKAAAVAKAPNVAGWLHRSACYETRNLMRAQMNRLIRETEAQRLGVVSPDQRPDPGALGVVIDDALCALSEADREAILARYFQNRSYAEIGTGLRVSENAARMRIDRALDKLRNRLERHGVTSSATALAVALPSIAIASVPATIVRTVTKAAVAGSVGAGGLGTAAILSMSKAKVVTGLVLAAAGGGLIYQYQQTAELKSTLAAVQQEASTAASQVQAMQRQVAELRQRTGAPARALVPLSAEGAMATAKPSPTAEPPPLVPGVTPKAPKGWFKNGSANDLYEVGVDGNNSWGGMPSAYAKSTGAADGKFGGMMQTISADAYKNQRVKLTGWMKTEDANDGGGHLWMRIDGAEGGRMLQFDNMDGRAPKGTSDWQEYSVVLDVPADASHVNYGFFVQGKGRVWVNGMTITPVGNDVPSTNMTNATAPLPKNPVNLGFTPPKEG